MASASEEPKPSTYSEEFWIYAENDTTKNNREHTEKGGKWMIFRPHHSIDDAWDIVKKGTEEGRFGHASKVSTRKDKGMNDGRAVICVYTYDWTDEADVMRVRQALRELGFTETLAYKTDEDTLAGVYRHTGHKRVSKYHS